jgi:DNA-binding transcriptional LysR family regulator
MSGPSQIYDVDLKLLRCFCAIVEEGSFNAAQATLNLSQSVLSEHLKSLEIRLGTRLCQRGPKGFKLYREGEIVYQAAKELFASIEVFKQRASTLNESAYGELVVGIQDGIVDNPSARIDEAIERFTSYYPNIRFKIEIMLGFQMAGKVADGLIHVGIGLGTDQFEQLTFEHLFDEVTLLCCGRSHPLFSVPDRSITMEHIASSAYCSRGHLEDIHPAPNSHYFKTFGDIGHGAHAKLALVLCGRNIGYVPEHVAKPHIEGGALRVIRSEVTRRVCPITAVRRPSSSEFKLAERFVDSLIDIHMETPSAARRAAPVTRSDGVAPIIVPELRSCSAIVAAGSTKVTARTQKSPKENAIADWVGNQPSHATNTR